MSVVEDLTELPVNIVSPSSKIDEKKGSPEKKFKTGPKKKINKNIRENIQGELIDLSKLMISFRRKRQNRLLLSKMKKVLKVR